MKLKQRLFVYQPREIVVLTLLVMTVATFTFTLGVHFGKRLNRSMLGSGSGETTHLVPQADRIPNPHDLSAPEKGAEQAVEDTLTHSLHEEVTRTGIKIQPVRQIDLPRNPASENAGATHLKNLSGKAEKTHGGKFTLQVASYPTEDEAKKRLESLHHLNIEAYVHETTLLGKGKRYRVYLGQYPTRAAADEAGQSYRSKHMISSFIIAPLED